MKRIVLVCAAGMSTSLLMKKMRIAAKELNYNVMIEAYPIAEAEDIGNQADIVLLGPQVRHQIDEVREVVDCPVEALDMRAYGLMDGKKVMQQVMDILKES